MIDYEREFIPYVPPVIPEGYELIYEYDPGDNPQPIKVFDIADINVKKIFYIFDVDNEYSSGQNVAITGKMFTDVTGDRKFVNIPSTTTIMVTKQDGAFVCGVIDCSDGIINGYGFGALKSGYDKSKNYAYGDFPRVNGVDEPYKANTINHLILSNATNFNANSLYLNSLKVYAM